VVSVSHPLEQLHDDVLSGGARPHERESALTRDADSKVRALVLATFPLAVGMLWVKTPDDARPMFLLALLAIVLANIAGYVVPWQRFPRWVEMTAPLSTIVALTLMVAPVGGIDHGYGVVLIIPVLWLAIYADPADILVGLAITLGCLLLPLQDWFDYLPSQGSLHQRLFFFVQLVVVVIGVRPVIEPLRDQLRRNRRAVDALHASQATLVHDLRNPLSAVRSLATLTQQRVEFGGDDPSFKAKVAEYAGVIISSTDRAEQVIDGVLELARAGEQLPHVDTIDLPALIDDDASGMSRVRVQTAAAPRTIVGHPPSIARLFANLLENAAQHAREDAGEPGRVLVTVTGRELAAGWLLTVQDDGRGLEPGEVDLLFHPWRRGVEAGAGSGLGLAIVEGIVAQHGGTISASNVEPSGAAFTFTLSRRPSVAPNPSETREASERHDSAPA
jgi:signal transduction histidine kinase